MCTSPLHKKNPYFGADPGSHPGHNVEDLYLQIPCGHCAECLATKQASFAQRVQAESEYNHLFFATLTYDNKHLPSIYVDVIDHEEEAGEPCRLETSTEEPEILLKTLFSQDASEREAAREAAAMLRTRSEELEASFESAVAGADSVSQLFELEDGVLFDDEQDTGHYTITERSNCIKVDYADIHHLQLMFKRMRDNNTIGRNFKYLAVSERGTSRGRPHFHVLFFIPKQKGDSVATCETINERLKDMLLHYWSTNVGTRKNPVYERNFTYKQRWIDGRLYRNFDCHYVNPLLTTEGVANVAYYVTKYIFKDSDKENQLKQLLFNNSATLEEFHLVWDLVKSRCVISKGLGLDAVMVTIPKLVQEPKAAFEIAEELNCQVGVYEDLPEDDFNLAPVSTFRDVWKKKRIIVPNFELMQKIKSNAMLNPESGHAVFVSYNGKHVPLANYYVKRVLSLKDLTDLYYSWDPIKYPVDDCRYEHIDHKKAEWKLQKQRKLIDQHEVVDSYAHQIEQYGQSVDPYDPYHGIAKYYDLDKVHPKMVLGK